MGKYLDKTGLQYFYGKLKEKFADKTTIENKLDSLTGALTWKGKFDALPTVADYETGSVVGVGNKEYVLTVTGSTKAWEELGDEGSYLLKSAAEETYAKKTSIPTVNDPKVSIKMNGVEKGSFTLNQAAVGEVDLGTVITEHQDISGKVDKTSLTPVLQAIDFLYAETDAKRKALLDKFATDWKALTGARNLDGARFVGIFFIEDPYDGMYRVVTGIMTYCAGDGDGDTNDNSFYGVCNGYSFSRQKSNIAIKVSLTDGSITVTPLFSHLEAITIYTDNTAEHKKANLDNIAAYEANLQALGVDTSKGFSFLANAGEYVMTFMKSRNGNHQFFAIQTYNNENYITFIDTDGTYTESAFSGIYANRAYAESTYLKKSDSITEVKMNGVSKGTSGVVDLGTVLTEHQSLKTINGEAITGSGDITIKGDVTKCRINANTLVAEPTGNEPIIFKMPLADVKKYKNYDVIEIYSVENGVETVMYTVYHSAFSEFYATSNGTGWLTGIFIGDETTTDENKIGFELIMSETVDTVDKDAKEPISSRAVYAALQGKQDNLSHVLKELDLTGTDADRKAKLDQFEKDWKTLTNATDMTGARFACHITTTTGDGYAILVYDGADGAYIGVITDDSYKSYIVHVVESNGSIFAEPVGGNTETDTSMSDTSTNPVQNKVIKAYIDGLVGNVAVQLAQI